MSIYIYNVFHIIFGVLLYLDIKKKFLFSSLPDIDKIPQICLPRLVTYCLKKYFTNTNIRYEFVNFLKPSIVSTVHFLNI